MVEFHHIGVEKSTQFSKTKTYCHSYILIVGIPAIPACTSTCLLLWGSFQRRGCSIHYIVYRVQYIGCSFNHTVLLYIKNCTVHSVQFLVYSLPSYLLSRVYKCIYDVFSKDCTFFIVHFEIYYV